MGIMVIGGILVVLCLGFIAMSPRLASWTQVDDGSGEGEEASDAAAEGVDGCDCGGGDGGGGGD